MKNHLLANCSVGLSIHKILPWCSPGVKHSSLKYKVLMARFQLTGKMGWENSGGAVAASFSFKKLPPFLVLKTALEMSKSSSKPAVTVCSSW